MLLYVQLYSEFTAQLTWSARAFLCDIPVGGVKVSHTLCGVGKGMKFSVVYCNG